MSHFDRSPRIGTERSVLERDLQAAVAEFIRANGVTRCPTACLVPTDGLVDVADRLALAEYAVKRERLRQAAQTDDEFLK
jgi:hypothetical protein